MAEVQSEGPVHREYAGRLGECPLAGARGMDRLVVIMYGGEDAHATMRTSKLGELNVKV